MRAEAENILAGLGDVLLRERLLDELALARAKRAQTKSGERLDIVLMRLGLVPERDIALRPARLHPPGTLLCL